MAGWSPGPTPRPYPLANLARRLGIDPADTQALSVQLGISRRWIRRYRIFGLTERQADEWATKRAGVGPEEVWDYWYTDLRGAALLNAYRTTCPQGHPYDRVDSRGYRTCSTCRRKKNENTQVTALTPTVCDLQRHTAPHPDDIIANVTTRDVMTEREAADYLRRPPATLRQWRHLRQGPPYVRDGRLIRYLRTDLDAYIASRRVDPQREAEAS